MHRRETRFDHKGRSHVCQFVFDDAKSGPRPGVLVVPAFSGLKTFELEQAEKLAALGYAALAVDYYGDG
ncbi:MAG: dienelactone hydrolase family protein, partial [Pseudomonadota bacterium]